MKQGLIPFDKLAVLYVLGRFSLHPDRAAARPPAVPRARHAALLMHGASAPSAAAETACVTAAALLGGHARVGFENNFTLPYGGRADSNAELVGAAARALWGSRASDPNAGGVAGGNRGQAHGLVTASGVANFA